MIERILLSIILGGCVVSLETPNPQDGHIPLAHRARIARHKTHARRVLNAFGATATC